MKTTSKGKFDRLLKILAILDEGGKCNAGDLSKDLGVSERSIYRYAASLVGAGFPIYFDPQKKTYKFEEGYSLKRTRLNPDEALALALAGKILGPLGITFKKAIESITARVINGANFEAIQLKTPHSKAMLDLPSLIKNLSSACTENQLVRIQYSSLYSEEHTTRDIEPYFIFLSPDGFWNLRAYCKMRDDWRVFALDRIIDLSLLDAFFIPRDSVDALKRSMTEGFGTFLDGEATEVVVQFSPVIRRFVERAEWHPSQKSVNLPNGWLEVRFRTLGTEAMKYWLYRWIPHVRVLEPIELREQMCEDLGQQSRLL